MEPVETHGGAQDSPQTRLQRRGARALDAVDSFFYLLVGIAFLGAAGLTLVYSITNLFIGVMSSLSRSTTGTLTAGIASNVLSFISDLLLVLIILEVLGTVRSYLDKHTNSVQPFLFIGIISATRGILSTGAHLSIALAAPDSSIQLTTGQFQSDIIQLGINALVIIALGATLRIMGPYSRIDVDES
ncbi:MAG TPA: phosphate-starvation-inducible PsiE family protein [Ktedonobacterales bacterium]